MARKAVYSSFVGALDWNPETSTLTVEYQNGRQTRHVVDEDTAMKVWNAPSIGEALHANIEGFTKRGPRGGNAG